MWQRCMRDVRARHTRCRDRVVVSKFLVREGLLDEVDRWRQFNRRVSMVPLLFSSLTHRVVDAVHAVPLRPRNEKRRAAENALNNEVPVAAVSSSTRSGLVSFSAGTSGIARSETLGVDPS